MKIDLCKLLGVEEEEEFKIYGYEAIYFIQNGYLYFIGDYGEQKSYLNINEVVGKNIIKLQKKKEFSQDTLNFFKMIDKRWGWIAKDKDGRVFVYDGKPIKTKSYNWDCSKYCRKLDALNQSLFDQIHWEDEEPIRIDDYVERKESV